eukprot:340461_1
MCHIQYSILITVTLCFTKTMVTQTNDPTLEPSYNPTTYPTIEPVFDPTSDPTLEPTIQPSIVPSFIPSNSPSKSPTDTSISPTFESIAPTQKPTKSPTPLVTDCGTRKRCYYTNIPLQQDTVTSIDISITDAVVGGFESYYDIYITPVLHDCINPRISFRYERIDNDLDETD